MLLRRYIREISLALIDFYANRAVRIGKYYKAKPPSNGEGGFVLIRELQ